MRNKFYSCNIKTHVLGFNKHLGKHFQHPAGCGRVFPAKNCRDTEEVVVGWQEVIWQMRQNFVAQFVQLLKHWLCDMQ